MTLDENTSAAASAKAPAELFNASPLDFSREEERSRFAQALAQVRGQYGRKYPVIIGGQEIAPPEGQPLSEEGGWMRSIDPSHPEEVVGWVAKATQSQAEQAMQTASKAFGQWSQQSVQERARALRQTADYIEARRYEYAAWAVHEAGKPWREADGDVCEAMDFLRYYAREMELLAPPQVLQPIPGERNEYAYYPVGVSVVIAPWNFPMAILTGMTSAALVAGNTVVMKPAEQSPVCAYMIFRAFIEGGGLPAGVLNYLPGVGEEVGETLISHPQSAIIAFTGSMAVGLHINEVAARVSEQKSAITRVIAEMGGKNAILVDSSADLDAAVTGTLKSSFFYAGQKCSAASRAIILEDVYEAFSERLRAAALSLRVGPAEEPETQVGPVIDAEALMRILRYGGRRAEAHTGELSQFVAPTILEVQDPMCPAAQEEIFGPVVALLRVSSFEQAIEMANATRFGLTAGLYSRTPSHIEFARQHLLAGNIYVNRPITGAIVGRQPFGGFKMSGIGSKAGGPDYLKQFLMPRSFSENTMRHGFTPDVLGPDVD